MRISDWSSDVCSSDLDRAALVARDPLLEERPVVELQASGLLGDVDIERRARKNGAQDDRQQQDHCSHFNVPGLGKGLASSRSATVDKTRSAAARSSIDRKSKRLNSSHYCASHMPSSA